LFIELRDITHLKAEGSYVNIYLNDGNKILVSKNIKDYESQLTAEEGFFRTHRSFMVNVAHIKKISPDHTEASLTNNHTISIARERKTEFGLYLRDYAVA
jgi:two-component system LytT family response regulator